MEIPKSRAIDDCEFCGGLGDVVLRESSPSCTAVRACGKCNSKIDDGEPLIDIYDFTWWKEDKEYIAKLKSDKGVPKGTRPKWKGEKA